MPSPRLRLWQVLRDEYKLFKGTAPELTHDWSFKREQLEHPIQLALRLREPADKVSEHLQSKLSPETQEQLKKFSGNEHPSPKLQEGLVAGLNVLLAEPNLYQRCDEEVVRDVLKGAELPEPIDFQNPSLSADKLPQVNRWLIEATYPEEIESIDQSITRDYYREIQKENHSALCLSGGGIRSATFNLGLLQGLARHGLLGEFHYLSTVSGGGFSGGWLSAWIKRHPDGIEGVMKELGMGEDPAALQTKQEQAATPAPLAPKPHKPPLQPKPLEPEPEALAWLRSYSNFLSPKPGLFSADTWTLVATLLRNIFLNWLVFVPVLMAALMLPRLWVAFLSFISGNNFAPGVVESWSIPIAFLMGMGALLYIGLNLPSTRLFNSKQKGFLLFCLLPLIFSAMALAVYVLRASFQNAPHSLLNFVIYQLAIIAIPWFGCAVLQYRVRKKNASTGEHVKYWFLIKHYVLATILIFGVQAITACLMWKAATTWADMNTAPGIILFYACFAVPVILALLALTGLLLAGLTGNYTNDEDQEWWARAGAWVFIAIIGWSVIFVLVIYGPQLFIELPRRIARGEIFSKEVMATVVGIVSGAISLYGGFSAKAPATDEETQKSGLTGVLMQLLINVAAAVFLIFIIIVLALLTNTLLVSLFGGPWLDTGSAMPGAYLHSFIIEESPGLLLLLLMVILIILGLFFGRLINTNKFSLHYLWRNRIIRAYLGASNPNRHPNHFTGFDRKDDLQMYELKPAGAKRRLLHVLNFALNLVGGEQLAWQERKAESFTASPLHCGNYRIGYRRSEWYGGQPKATDDQRKKGISLGTSIAISGAFVSPNMGYMQTSPVIRFLMTLFNVRFGWWLGNSGRAGDSRKLPTYERDSPRLSIKPIVEEALGLTNDESSYVYLSDGGHFENFGLYEMVLRRCRLIVIGDASSDAEYAFQSLGQSLRKIRIDFGIPIKFENFSISKPSRDGKGVYAAYGTIPYRCIDGSDAEDGVLILIKPTLTGSEERDVLNYASESGAFPQEFIGDQWFSESQFESYRALGSHIVDTLCKDPDPKAKIDDRKLFTLEEFQKRVKDNLDMASESDFGEKALEYLRKNIP